MFTNSPLHDCIQWEAVLDAFSRPQINVLAHTSCCACIMRVRFCLQAVAKCKALKKEVQDLAVRVYEAADALQ